ncbi:fimbrial biogenesis chaperone [Pseudomonas vranovensis]|uniref:fimbrial biogenesis chaperone n=1 Tax=Pseudomonas vranovensis TaxID=321661 RepID=UPI003D95419C
MTNPLRTRFTHPLVNLASCAVAVLALLASLHSHASVTLSATRIIFDASKSDASITAGNTSNQPYAVQAWVNTQADDNSVATAFMATPPLFRLDARKEQMVRIIYTGGELPTDRESVFYFNAQEIPMATTGDENVLKVALRTRIKLFYRPVGLKGSLTEALAQLRWSTVREDGETLLRVQNPSPFHVTFIGIKAAFGKQERELDEPTMVAPFAEQRYALDALGSATPEAVVFSAINDYGGYTEPTRVSLTATH